MWTDESRQTLKQIVVKKKVTCLVLLLSKTQVISEHSQPLHRNIQEPEANLRRMDRN